MLTRRQAIELWQSDDLVALGFQADALRKQLHPEGVVSYTLASDEAVMEHVFALKDNLDAYLDSLDQIRQDATWQAFRPLVGRGATGVDYVKAIAVSRLYLQNVPHIQASIRPFGLKVAQLALRFGANDLELDGMAEEELRRVIRDAGFSPKQRDALFRTYAIA